MLFVLRENHLELGTLLWQRGEEEDLVQVHVQCQHEAELIGVKWLIRLEISTANYPETDINRWGKWSVKTDGLKVEAFWAVREETSPRVIRGLSESFSHSVYYYRTHEKETLENAREMRLISESDAQRLLEEAERREADREEEESLYDWFLTEEAKRVYPEAFE